MSLTKFYKLKQCLHSQLHGAVVFFKLKASGYELICDQMMPMEEYTSQDCSFILNLN